MTKRTKTLIVLVLLAMGTDFALDRIIVQRFNRVHFVPVRRRIEIEEGFHITQGFTVSYSADYEVGLECRRALPHDDLDGLLQSNLNLTYAVFEDESLLVRVDSTNLLHGGAYTDDRITRMLGGFPASPGREYRIDILVRNSIPVLAATEPTLTVRLDPIARTTICYGPATPFVLARVVVDCLGIMLALCVALPQLIHWVKRRRGTNGEKTSAAGSR